MSCDLVLTEIVLLAIFLTAVVYDKRSASRVAFVGNDSYMRVVTENNDVTRLPLFDIIDVNGKRDRIFRKEHLKIANTSEIYI